MKSSKQNSDAQNEKGFDPINRRYIRLNTEAWLKQHAIRKEGESRGKEEQPDSSQSAPDHVYLQIVSFVRERALACKNDVRKHINHQLATLTGLTSNWVKQNPEISLEAMIDRECHDLESIAAQGLSDLEPQRDEFEQATREIRQFREKNKLDRVADYPVSQVAHWLWVPVAGVVESFVSANLLGSVTRGGTIEGWMVALVLTAVNVLIGFGAGRAWRFTNYAVTHIRIMSFVALVLCIFVALIWNTTAGHVRDVYVLAEASGALEAPDQAFAVAFAKLIENPLPWASLQSAGLAFVGIAVFVLTTYKSYTSDDRYPGYGARHRQVEDLRLRYQEELDSALQVLKSKRDQTNIQIDEFKNRHELDRSSWENVHEEIKTTIADYTPNLRQYNDDMAYLLAEYRDANLSARTTRPPPFFEDTLMIDEDVIQPPDIEIPPPFEWGDISKKASEGYARIEESYQKLHNKYQMLNQVTDDRVTLAE